MTALHQDLISACYCFYAPLEKGHGVMAEKSKRLLVLPVIHVPLPPSSI